MNSQGVKGLPVLDGDYAIYQGNLRPIPEGLLLCVRQFRTKVRYHHVPASQHRAFGADVVYLFLASITDFYFFRRRGIADMSHPQCCTAQSNPHGNVVPIKLRVVELRRDDIFGRMASCRLRDERLYDCPRDRSVSVWKVEVIGFLFGCGFPHRGETHATVRTRRDAHSLETGETKAPTIERRNSVDPHSKQSVRPGLVERNHARIDFDQLQKKILVAHSRQLFLFFVGRNSR